MHIQDRLRRCLDFLVRLPSQAGLASVLSGRQGYELISPSWQGSKNGSFSHYGSLRIQIAKLPIQIRPSAGALTLAGLSTQVLLRYAASQVLQPGFQFGQSGGYAQQ